MNCDILLYVPMTNDLKSGSLSVRDLIDGLKIASKTRAGSPAIKGSVS